MRLAMFTRERVFLLAAMLLRVFRLGGYSGLLGLFEVVDYFGRCSIKEFDGLVEIANKGFATVTTKVLADDDTEEFETLCVWSHSIRGYDPSSASQMSRDSEFIVMFLVRQPPCNERKTFTVPLAHDGEFLAIADFLDGIGEEIGSLGEVAHYSAISALSKTEELVILPDNLNAGFGKVESERDLRGSEVIDGEEDFFREEFLLTPERPTDTGIGQSVFVT